MMAKHSENFGGAKAYDICVVKLLLAELRSSSLLYRKPKLRYLKTQRNIWSGESLGAKMIQCLDCCDLAFGGILQAAWGQR